CAVICRRHGCLSTHVPAQTVVDVCMGLCLVHWCTPAADGSPERWLGHVLPVRGACERASHHDSSDCFRPPRSAGKLRAIVLHNSGACTDYLSPTGTSDNSATHAWLAVFHAARIGG